MEAAIERERSRENYGRREMESIWEAEKQAVVTSEARAKVASAHWLLLESQARIALRKAEMFKGEEQRWRAMLDAAQETAKRELLHEKELSRVRWSRTTSRTGKDDEAEASWQETEYRECDKPSEMEWTTEDVLQYDGTSRQVTVATLCEDDEATNSSIKRKWAEEEETAFINSAKCISTETLDDDKSTSVEGEISMSPPEIVKDISDHDAVLAANRTIDYENRVTMLEAIRRRAWKRKRSQLPNVADQKHTMQQSKRIEREEAREEASLPAVILLPYGAGPLQWSHGARALEWSQRQERIIRRAQEEAQQEREDLETEAKAYQASRASM